MIACTLSATGALLTGYAAAGSELSAASWTAAPHVGTLALLYGTVLLILTSRPVRAVVGRGPRPDPARTSGTVPA